MRYAERESEIWEAVAQGEQSHETVMIPVVPVRMLEAWLLLDEYAIRYAAGNPRGRQPLKLPPAHEIEGLVDPKTMLAERLRWAAGNHAPRQSVTECFAALGRQIDQFTELLRLPAFQRLDAAIADAIRQQHW